jgi:ABC-type methionine transport system ATPase subunit
VTRGALVLAVIGAGAVSVAAAQSVAVSGSTQLTVPLSVIVTGIIGIFGAGGTWAWLHSRVKHTEDGMTELEEKTIPALQRAVDTKAPLEEMNRQRDNVGTLFTKFDELKDTVHDLHAVTLNTIGEHRAQIQDSMHEHHREIEKLLRESVADRRREPRTGEHRAPGGGA